MSRISLGGYRAVPVEEFDVGPLTVLFGRNNVGKTYILEAIYGVLAPHVFFDESNRIRDLRADTGAYGAVYVDLEQGLEFDDAVLTLIPDNVDGGYLRFPRLPQDQVCYASTPDNTSLPNPDWQQELWFVDLRDYWTKTDLDGEIRDDVSPDEVHPVDERTRLVGAEPRVRPVFLGWEFSDVDRWVTAAIADLSVVPDRWQDTDGGFPITHIPGSRGVLMRFQGAKLDEDDRIKEAEALLGRKRTRLVVDPHRDAWRVRPEVVARLDQLAALATDLLPDFLDGLIRTELIVPTEWAGSPHVRVQYVERGSDNGHPINDFGRGASRWLSIALQVAIHIMEKDWLTSGVLDDAGRRFSGSVLLVDEPEAHLHPSAVASVVRWCRRMVNAGFQVVAASHHEEFLRTTGSDVRFVKVTRGDGTWTDVAGELQDAVLTRARTLSSAATPVLQELAAEVGMHPAVALSLRRAVLFVEGTLDEAVLDEYAGPALDAAGVLIVPIHGTKNLEGLIDSELTVRLGIKMGILTDNTVTATMHERPRKRRSGEERKVIRLIRTFESRGLPLPTVFGIPEDDLLFALPADGIRQHAAGLARGNLADFPGWHELVQECRDALGETSPASAPWKEHAQKHYGLPIESPEGVRRLVRALDLAGVEMPSVRRVVDQIVGWAGR
ncbi:AAA family ATPase [Mycolicibacterium sp. XJ879]